MAAGSTISLVVAKAPTTAQVPDVTGETRDDAVNALNDAGFRSPKDQADDQPEQDGNVVAQSPAGNAEQGQQGHDRRRWFTPPPTTTPTTPTTPTTTPTTSNTP